MVEANLAALIHTLPAPEPLAGQQGARGAAARRAGEAILSNRAGVEYSNEGELLAACRRREIAAFEQVYLTHGGRLKSIAWQILRNRPDAEDAVQETFLKLYRGIEGFQGQSNIGTWLCRILINTCHDLARKRKREAEPQTEERTAGPKNQLALKVTLDDALRRIHPRHRMVFHLFEVEGMKHAEIAAILEVPEGTSKAWLFEARKELKRMLMETRR